MPYLTDAQAKMWLEVSATTRSHPDPIWGRLVTDKQRHLVDVEDVLIVDGQSKTQGLTGLWQVSGRSLLSWEESVRLDLRYVENWCLSMDLLLWKTVWAVLAKRGAY